MEVMAEANEQRALLNQDVDEVKKPRRTKTAARPRRTTAGKTGARKAKKQTTDDKPTGADTNSHTTELDRQDSVPTQDTKDAPEPVSARSRGTVEPPTQANDLPPRTHDQNSVAMSEPREAAVSTAPAPPRFQETPPVAEAPRYDPVFGEGLIEVSGKGFGFLRDPKRNYVQSPQDIFVTPEVVRKHALRDGLWIKGEVRRGSRGPQLFKLLLINGEDPDKYRNLPVFEELTSINPLERIRLETVPDRYTTRVMDLMTPIGKGQRGLIVAPPRTGKTTLLQHIADAVVRNHTEVKLIILLVDERPEEVTEIRRTVPKADIMASSNDSDIKSHTRIAQLAIERAKRLVEAGKDVFVLLDSLTRVGRAFNNAISGSGRTMSGGMDSRAMEIPRKLFAAARNTEEAGSLTIMATALIETGSKMDELIFQEFKGTGNMEMVLDRQISDQRIYPAIDIFKSGTRREELLIPAHDLEKINTIRRGLAGHRPPEAIERLLSFLKKFPTNSQMLREIPG
jgi:transcription termination factor Rho